MKDSHSTPVRSSSFLRYIVRYLLSHKSYLYNTFALCIFAGFMAYMLEQMHLDSYLPLGFAVLSFNTPIGILLSSNRGLHRKIQMPPGQLERIVVPYGLFILAVNLFIYAIYLACWQLFHGSLEIMYYVLSVLFAAQCAISTVWLEWKHPFSVGRWRATYGIIPQICRSAHHVFIGGHGDKHGVGCVYDRSAGRDRDGFDF